MKNVKRLLGMLLVMVMVVSSVGIGLGTKTFKAVVPADKSASQAGALPAAVTFYVPETIYLTPSLTTATTFQYYVDSNSNGTLDNSKAKTTGTVYFNCDSATAVSIACSGASYSMGTTTGSTTVNTTITSGTLLSGLSQGAVSTLTWTATYTVAGQTMTAIAYTVCYAPKIEPIGVANGLYNNGVGFAIYKAKLEGFAYVSGVQGFSSGGMNRFRVHTDMYVCPLLGVVSEPTGNMYNSSWLLGYSGGVNIGYLADPADQLTVIRNSPTGTLTVDTSRYSDLNQVPNLTCGLVITNLSQVKGWFAYYITNYNNGTTYLNDCFLYTNLEQNDAFRDHGATGNDYAEPYLGSACLPQSLSTGIKFGGQTGVNVYSQPLSTADGTQLMRMKAAAWAQNITNMTKWNCIIMLVNTEITRSNKTALRTAIRTYTNYGLQSSDYTAGTWTTFSNALSAAAANLGNPTASAVATTTLDDAYNGLVHKTYTATITHAGTDGNFSENETITFNSGDTVTANKNSYNGYTCPTDTQTWTNQRADITFTFNYIPNATYCTITFDANGGTGGTSGSMQCGTILTPPKVTKEGYVFKEWSPFAPPTVPATNTTFTAQYIKTTVIITKLAEGFKVNIMGWAADYKYQIWSYQKITGDMFPENSSNQWVLSKAYTLGSAGALQPDGSINFFIDDFTSASSTYTVSVRIMNSSNKFAGEIRDSYTSAEVQEVKITKVLVDGDYAKSMVIEEIEASSPLVFTVIGNNIANTVFDATVLESAPQITSISSNEFSWDTSAAEPGIYTVQLTASNDETSDTMNVKVQLYSLNTNIQYGNIDGLSLPEIADNSLPKTVAITPSFTNGTFYYKISESGRVPIYTSGLFEPTDNIQYTFNKYGTYFFQGFVNREYEVRIGGNYDDGFFKTLEVSRSKTEPSSATLVSNTNIENPVAKGNQVTFTANAAIGGIGDIPVQYSFWRYDAKGYVLVKDWSIDNTLDWTPAHVGIYTIVVRAKGEDAGSYEVLKSVRVTVNDDTDQIAQDVVITLNKDELNANATARVPVNIIASANSSNCEDLFYKFYVSDEAMGTSELQDYSINQECIWTPRKAGTYTISVLVKNGTSYGAYDAIKTFDITVD